MSTDRLIAEQVRDAVMSADRWEKPMGHTGLTNTHLIIRDDGWQAIADELNAKLDTRADDYRQAAEYWQRMYEEAFAERTCRIEQRYGDWYCTGCSEMVGTCDTASELYIDGNAVETWNYCPNCGARVVE